MKKIKKYLDDFFSDEILEKKIIWIVNGITFFFIIIAILEIFHYTFSAVTFKFLKNELYKVQSQRNPSQEKELKQKAEKLKILSSVLKNQTRAKKIFEFLEKNLLKDVEIKSLSISFKTNTIRLSLSSFSVIPLTLQMNVFKTIPEIKKVELLNMSFDKKQNQSSFDLEIEVDPKLWSS